MKIANRHIKLLDRISKRLQDAHRRGVVDELGKLHRKFERVWKKNEARYKKLKEEAARWPAADEEPGDQPVIYRGRIYELEYTPAGKKREITDKGGVMNTLTQPVFLAHCSFPLDTLDVLLPTAAELGLVKEDPNGGTRRVEIRPRSRRQAVAA